MCSGRGSLIPLIVPLSMKVGIRVKTASSDMQLLLSRFPFGAAGNQAILWIAFLFSVWAGEASCVSTIRQAYTALVVAKSEQSVVQAVCRCSSTSSRISKGIEATRDDYR